MTTARCAASRPRIRRRKATRGGVGPGTEEDAMKYFFSKDEAEVVRIEGEAPRTLYPCVEPGTTGTRQFSMGLQQVDPHSRIPLHSHDEAEEILFVIGGRATATVGDETAEIVAGVRRVHTAADQPRLRQRRRRAAVADLDLLSPGLRGGTFGESPKARCNSRRFSRKAAASSGRPLPGRRRRHSRSRTGSEGVERPRFARGREEIPCLTTRSASSAPARWAAPSSRGS